ncbi:hypothetical protein FACS1894182_12170 [Bacteroidia bacterium]|nr:hypothetical protein FACS1894182_12170 [Bacteroidia bacterium]
MTVAVMQSLFSQDTTERKKAWIDFQAVQQIGLGKWSNADYVNDGFPATSMTEIRGVFNCLLVRPVYGFLDMGIGIMPGSNMKSFNLDRMPMPYNGTQYYLREMLSESGSGQTSAHFKYAAGLFTDFKATENLSIMPYFGAGGLSMSQLRSYEMILKEQGSNMQYNTMYIWGYENSEGYNDGSIMLGYLTGRLNFKYKISPKSNLLLGLEYTHFFQALDFYGRYYNTFNGNIQRDFIVKGNKMNMLGISAGISFR